MSAANQWNQGGVPQMSANQMWANYQQYAAYGYPYQYVAPGYPPVGYPAVQGAANSYPPPSYAVGNPNMGPSGYPMWSHNQQPVGYSASAPNGYRQPGYGSEGPPTKKQLTSDTQLSSTATYTHAAPHVSQSAGQSSGQGTVKPYTAASNSAGGTTAPKTEGQDWPPSLLKYVTRCFSSVDSKDTPALEAKLKDMINLAERTKTLWSRDWDAMPVPSLGSVDNSGGSGQFGSNSRDQVQFTVAGSSSSLRSPAKGKSKLSQQSGASFSTEVPKSGKSRKEKASTKVMGKKYGDSSQGEEEKKEKRASRFAAMSSSTPSIESRSGYGEADYDVGEATALVGTNTSLEKSFYRLIERPQASSVRPRSVLKKSLDLMRQKKLEGASWTGYLNEQMKSIRQDLVIQAIHDDFALEVYETNARWCLENDDVPEFKRCLLRIDEFYHHLDLSSPHQDEFCCYSLLYHLLPEDFPSLNAELASLPTGLKSHPAIQHATKICDSYLSNNWHLFFLLSSKTFFLERHILDKICDRVRINALSSIFISYRPTVPIDWIAKQTGFDSHRDALSWFTDHDCVFADPKRTSLDTKDSLKGLLDWETKNKPGK